MRHPTPDELLPLLQAVDTACWCLAVKDATKKGQRCGVDWKASLRELCDAYEKFIIAQDDTEAIEQKGEK